MGLGCYPRTRKVVGRPDSNGRPPAPVEGCRRGATAASHGRTAWLASFTQPLYHLPMDSTSTQNSAGVRPGADSLEPDVELAKADLAARIHRLVEHRRSSQEEVAALLNVATSELLHLFQGRLATCSLDQLLRTLTRLGDDIEILIRPRVQRTKRGVMRVLQTAAVERSDLLGSVRSEDLDRRVAPASASRRSSSENGATHTVQTAKTQTDETQLLDKWHIETLTSLDITTIYRKMKAGSFPQPLKVGRRRVVWRRSDIMRWQQQLPVGTERAAWMDDISRSGNRPRGGGRRRRR